MSTDRQDRDVRPRWDIPPTCPECGTPVTGAYMNSPRQPGDGPPKLTPCLHPAPATPPRTWALPVIPEDVKAVRDAEGMIWRRQPSPWGTVEWSNADSVLLDDSGLITYHSPLTEVLEDNRG